MPTPRTNATQMAGILDVDVTIDVAPFIEVANSLVTELCAPGIADTARLEMIERYLACHLYAIRDQLPQSEGAGGVSSSYQGKTDLFLSGSQYGQTACLLDSTGNLSKINKQLPRTSPSVYWVGTNCHHKP